MNVLENRPQDILFQIMMPYAFNRIKQFETGNKCLAYYTNTETATKILEKREFWLRNVSAMNDYSEVNYGIRKINKLFPPNSVYEDKNFYDTGMRLKSALINYVDSDGNNIFNKALQQFLNEQISWVFNTYIICFSEHNKEEDRYGRLSMWRAYGGDNGVAFVFKPRYRFQNYEKMGNIILTPVAYLDDDDFLIEVNSLIDSIIKNENILHQLSTQSIYLALINLLRYAIVSIKHPGFKEEQEWRIIAHGNNIKLETCCPHGVVQPISKLKICECTFNDMLDHIIVGPTPYENVIYKAFVDILKSGYSISDAETRVVPSRIPYRPV